MRGVKAPFFKLKQKDLIKHPATFTDRFIPIFAELLSDRGIVLDPFAGVGKLALIKDCGFSGKVICNEIEEEWVNGSQYSVDEWHIGDAANMSWAGDGYFDAICTSPTYGNRMADHHIAKDNSRRVTYRHYLGRPLNNENTGKMQWGQKYRDKHEDVYKECVRVLKPNGLFIVNVSDHIRKGEVVKVVDWHKEVLKSLCSTFLSERVIETPRMRFGKNSDVRVNSESILVFKK